jgi:hypothetical protein
MTNHGALQRFPPPMADRAAWAHAASGGASAHVVALGEAALDAAIPPYGRDDWERWWATGERLVAEGNHNSRRAGLMHLALAAGITGDPRFAHGAARWLEAILEEPTWLLCAHDHDYADHVLDPKRPAVDLFSAMTCQTIAEADAIIGDQLDPGLQARALAMTDERGVGFFLARDDHRWEIGKTSPNWAAVCAGSIAIAALLMEPPGPRLDAVLAKAERCFGSYFATFPNDGGCLEGVGYWEKSMAYVAMLGDMIERRRAGSWSPLDDARAIAIASFPARVALQPGLFPAFSDTAPRRSPEPALLNVLARRLNLPELDGVTPLRPAPRKLTSRPAGEKLRDLFWTPEHAASAAANLAAFDLLPQSQWAVARAPELDVALAIKGGCNDEPHNHNDVGSFVILLDGRTPVAELGAPAYDRAYFASATRYQYLAARSAGHCTPLVNGFEQRAGAEAAASSFTGRHDGMVSVVELDFAAAYPAAAGLASLTRNMRLDRQGAGRITLTDRASFAAGTGEFATVIVTLDRIAQAEPGFVLLHGETGRPLAIRFGLELDVSVLEDRAVALRDGPTDVRRLVFTRRPGSGEAVITLVFEPAPAHRPHPLPSGETS